MFKFLKRFKLVLQFWKFIPFIKDFFLSKEVQPHHKVLSLLMVLTYAFFPFDLIPDFLVLFGIVDDIVIATFVIDRMMKMAPQTLKKKHKLELQN